MKKLTLLFCIVLCLSACKDKTDNAEIELTIHDVTPSGLSFVLTNNTENEYTYGSDFSLYIRKNGVWKPVNPIIENWGFTAIGYGLLPESQTEMIAVNWSWLYGEIPSGTYKFQKKVLFTRSPGDFDEFAIEKEFSIP